MMPLSTIIAYDYPYDGEGPFYTEYYGELKEDFPEYGFDRLNWDETNNTYLAKHKKEICKMFDDRYKFEEIGQETPIRWFHFLQTRFDYLAPRYDHAYKAYEVNDVDQLGTGYTETEHNERELGVDNDSTTTTTNTSKFKDTPIGGVINNPTTMDEDKGSDIVDAHSLTRDAKDNTKQKIVHDDTMITEVNKLIDKYKVITTDFVEEFSDMFMTIYYNDIEVN